MKIQFDDLTYIIVLQLALISAVGIDYTVHSTLYSYGLQFSYNWAIQYWIFLAFLFLSFGLLGLSGYGIDRIKYNKKKALLVFSTIEAEYFGLILDTIVWTIPEIFTKASVDWTYNWWWSPYSKITGHWDLRYALILNIIVVVILAVAWYKVLKNE